MRTHIRVIAAGLIAAAAMAGVGQAQGAAPPAQGQPQAGEAPAGRGAGGRGQQPAEPARGRVGGARRGGFTQFTRALAAPDVLLRGKALYETNCASCHATDLRGSATGANLLRSGVALGDQHGELVGASVAKHTPALTLVQTDIVAIAEYIHSVHATMGGQGSPPGRNPTNVTLNVLVGDATAGQAAFGTYCASCHSVTGDLKGIATKISDPRALQNAWVLGSTSTFGGGRGGGGGGGAGSPATVTMADGSKIEGTLVRKNDFLVILTLPDGTRKSIPRANDLPKVEVKDPQAAHKAMLLKIDDAANKNLHDITAYLATIK
jgi:cytochrome c oxidase cbb3-type subunit 3